MDASKRTLRATLVMTAEGPAPSVRSSAAATSKLYQAGGYLIDISLGSDPRPVLHGQLLAEGGDSSQPGAVVLRTAGDVTVYPLGTHGAFDVSIPPRGAWALSIELPQVRIELPEEPAN